MSEAAAGSSSPHPGKPEVAPPTEPLGLFEGFGVEMEWMIVDAGTLDVRPAGDAILGAEGEVERGRMAWSNELALHVLEVKTHGPAPTLEGLADAFHAEALEADARLAPLGCRLLPGAAHPWMDPDRETRIWPHEYTEVYRAFDRIFGVRGHGWANLQSTHLNLPFSGDAEFAALHQAIRPVLALIPAIAAASPVLDGIVQPNMDERLERYRTNAHRVPAVSGGVIPEIMRSRKAYEGELLEGIYREMAPLDPQGTLRHEWVNARGAIARFQRGAIEIRVIDSQEAPTQDLAVLALVAAAVRRLAMAAVGEGSGRPEVASALERPSTLALRELLADTTRVAERAALAGPRASRSRREALAPVLDLLGVASLRPGDAGECWTAFAEVEGLEGEGVRTILERGPLARRLLRALGSAARTGGGGGGGGAEPAPGFAPTRTALRATWEGVADAFRENRPFLGP